MEYIKTFDEFINEGYNQINEDKKEKKIQPINAIRIVSLIKSSPTEDDNWI